MTSFTVLHPFNDGNGRTARAILPYTLKRVSQKPLYVENMRNIYHHFLDKVLYSEIRDIYSQAGLVDFDTDPKDALAQVSNKITSLDFRREYQDKIGKVLRYNIDALSLSQLRNDQVYNQTAVYLSKTKDNLN
jgi:hypothetical protein